MYIRLYKLKKISIDNYAFVCMTCVISEYFENSIRRMGCLTKVIRDDYYSSVSGSVSLRVVNALRT